MIQVTLTFTSLSAALMALREIPESTLTGALTDITPADEEEPAVAPAPKPLKKAKPSPAPALVAAPAPPTAAPTVDPLPGVAPAVSYTELQKAVLLLASKNRDAALGLATTMGVKTFKELDAARWPEALAAVNTKIAELGVMQ